MSFKIINGICAKTIRHHVGDGNSKEHDIQFGGHVLSTGLLLRFPYGGLGGNNMLDSNAPDIDREYYASFSGTISKMTILSESSGNIEFNLSINAINNNIVTFIPNISGINTTTHIFGPNVKFKSSDIIKISMGIRDAIGDTKIILTLTED